MVIKLPYNFQEGQKAYAAQLMADLNTLAGALNQVEVPGLAIGDLETALASLKAQTDQAVKAYQTGNAEQIKFQDGETIQDKLDKGELNGADGVVGTSDGMYYFYVGGDGHLYLVTRSQVQGEAFHINDQGHLIYTVDSPAPEAGEPKTYDLGNVQGPQGAAGDMQASVYDPSGKKQDLYAYVDQQVRAVTGSIAKTAWAYAAGWDENNRNTVAVEGLTALDDFYVGHGATATEAAREAWRDGSVFVAGQGEGFLTLEADGPLPAVDVPLSIIILP